MGQENKTQMSFFRRLAKDVTANTIAIAAASLVPLMAMVGGGVDASRYYMAETRLQAACDAGALAARRAMADDSFTSEHRTIGENFFDQNFETGMFGTQGLQRSFSATADGEVNGTATGSLPTSIMGAFGYNQFNLSVDCTADINISNTDIMFVVDVTGSMGCTPSGTSCPGGSSSSSRLQGLRDAVMTFYDTVEDSTSATAQVRYGMVPYSVNANVGDIIMAENPAWMAQSHTYQSREADWDITTTYAPTGYNYVRTGSPYSYSYQNNFETNDYGVSYSECVALINEQQDIYVSSNSSGWTLVSQTGTNPRTSVYTGTVRYEMHDFTGGYYYGYNDRCRLFYDRYYYYAQSTITVTEGETTTQEFFWAYRPVTWDISSLYDDNQIELPTGWEEALETSTWDGCVEEANTTAASSFDPVPSTAYDININLTPSNANEYWKPTLYNAVWKRENSSGNVLGELTGQTTSQNRPYYTCPTEAFRLTDISRSDMQSYVNSLTASGNTYHDIGMLWGARFISPDGMFAADNATAPNGDAISRHIVFMTDGELQPHTEYYNVYGVEWWDRRVSGNGDWTTTYNNHAARFQAACSLARQENISVWVVAFGTSLTQNLIDCATPGRAFAASDSSQLETTFQQIAQQIAALRLTQ